MALNKIDKRNEAAENMEVLMVVRRIVEKGNSAEIKRTTDGKLKVFEVKRSIAAGREVLH